MRKSLNIILLLGLSSFLIGADSRPTSRPEVSRPQIEKPKFPRHWGHPPQIQLRDQVKLPAKFGFGSSTLAKWIRDNLKRDADKGAPQPKPQPKPRPPVKPEPRPEPPAELKEKMDLYKKGQQHMQESLREKINALGKKPSREDVRKTVETYKQDNKQLIESQKELGKSINDWHKDNKPARPERPEPTAQVKEKIASMKAKQKEMDHIRKEFQATLKSSKDLTKEARGELIKEFKEKNADKHLALKEAQKEVQKEIRELKQTGARRQ